MSNNYRLPSNVTPSEYEIFIQTFLSPSILSFSGHSIVTFKISDSSSSIILHIGKDLIIDPSLITFKSPKDQIKKGKFERDEKAERASFMLEDGESFEEGQWQLSTTFQSELGKGMMGYYRSVWTQEEVEAKDLENQKEKTYYALTQFQATAARRVFVSYNHFKGHIC
jgi:aminopeptidase 2